MINIGCFWLMAEGSWKTHFSYHPHSCRLEALHLITWVSPQGCVSVFTTSLLHSEWSQRESKQESPGFYTTSPPKSQTIPSACSSWWETSHWVCSTFEGRKIKLHLWKGRTIQELWAYFKATTQAEPGYISITSPCLPEALSPIPCFSTKSSRQKQVERFFICPAPTSSKPSEEESCIHPTLQVCEGRCPT